MQKKLNLAQWLVVCFFSQFVETSLIKFCPNIEFVSSGSDFNIECNNSHLIFSQAQYNENQWNFVDPSSSCRQNQTKQQISFNQCGIEKKNSDYIMAPMISEPFGENACLYCQINYKPIAPSIIAEVAKLENDFSYRFNLTTDIIDPSQSFEIIWAKRLPPGRRYSITYWFLPNCINSLVKIEEVSQKTIVFTVEDSDSYRIEFFVRRCQIENCRRYEICDERSFDEEISGTEILSSMAIEKRVCDEVCLGFDETTTRPTTARPTKTTAERMTTSNILKSSNSLRKKVFLQYLPVFLFVIGFTILVICIVQRVKTHRQRHCYKRANQQPSKDTTSNVE